MKFFLVILLGTFVAVAAVSQERNFKSVNATLRSRFKLTSYETAFSGTTASGAGCDIFVKDKLYDSDGPVDEIVIVAQFESGSGFQHIGFQVGPATSNLRLEANGGKWTASASNNSWMANTSETLTLATSQRRDFPDVTISHQGNVGAPDYQNSCLDLRRN